MSRKSTLIVAFALLVCAMAGMASALDDYSIALGNDGALGVETPGALQLSGTFFNHNDMDDDAITDAVFPTDDGSFDIHDYRNVPLNALENLGSIKPVPEQGG